MSKQRKLILIAAAVGIVCMFLPWWTISIPFLGQTSSINGFYQFGVIVFLCLVVAGVMAYTGDQSTNLSRTNWMTVLIAGGVASLIMAISFFGALNSLSSLGIGFYGTLAGSIGVLAFNFMNRAATDSLQSGFDSLKEDINRTINTPASHSTSSTTISPVTHTKDTDTEDPAI